jgi:transglutaminase-like putative cysteine protease
MSFPFLLKLTIYCLALDALAALYLTDLLTGPTLAAVAATMGASWWVERLRPSIPNYRRLWELITVVFVVYTVLDFTLLAESFMSAVVHLLVFLLAYKLYNARNHRDLLDIFLLTFLILVSACLLTTSFGFLLVFCLYMILGVWGFILLHLRREADVTMLERSREALAAPGLITPGFLCSSLGVATASLILTLVIFFLIPRLGRTFLPLGGQFGTLTTGFTDRVELGIYGAIQSDPTIVMRVSFPEDVVAPERLPNLRWRGVAFDSFDGRSWTLTDAARSQVRRLRDGHYAVAPHPIGTPFLSYEVLLDPLGTEVLFGLPRVTAIQGRLPGVAVDGGGGLALPTPPTARIRYLAISQPERVREESLRRSTRATDYPRQIRETYLQLPTISPRVRALAQDLATGARTPVEIARKVEAYLTANLRYSLDLGRETDLDPLDDFLFERKTGNCEYFAAAMTVLLRAAGVPARVVNGFQRGEWNDVGRYFAVRQRDAHSWVEVFFPGAGWVTFDPSPRAAFEAQALSVSGWLAQHFDALRMRWNRYVVDYNVGDQALVTMKLRRQSASFRGRLVVLWESWSFTMRRNLRILWRHYGYAALGLSALVAALLIVCRRTRPGEVAAAWFLRARLRRTPVAFYERMLRILARRGWPRVPGATAREFVASLSSRPHIGGPAAELTTLYEQVRFGGQPLAPADGKRAAILLRQLEVAPR